LPPTPSQPAARARQALRRGEQIAAKNWSGAIDELKRLNDHRRRRLEQPDGYSLAQGPTPDFAGAEKFYTKRCASTRAPRRARILGELYLQTGDLAGPSSAWPARQGVLPSRARNTATEESDRAVQGQRRQASSSY